MELHEKNLVLQSTSCEDFILYYGDGEKDNFGYEAQFDSGEFNGVITFSQNVGDDFGEDWKPVVNKEMYAFIKEKAISDYHKKFHK